jgi:outer membrane protein OmpA-like peptidoglycan-associated protein
LNRLKMKTENPMKSLQKNIMTMGGVLVISVAGCATHPVPQDLLDARSSYQRVQSGPAMQNKPDQVHEARVALDKAEQSYLDSPGDQKTADLAYVANRKAELAEANSVTAQAQSVKGQAEDDAKQTTKGQLAQARGQLADASVQLASREQQLELEKTAHADADKRAKEAMDRLTATVGTVKQESRGMVITLSASVLFATNKDALLPGAQEKLAQVAAALKTQKDRETVVEGHTDTQGSAESNQGLSDRRARSVVTYLISQGVPADQIRGEGLGATRPVADNASAEGRANNRRVEIIVKPVKSH